ITQAWMQVEIISLVPPRCFYPAPEVASAIVRLIPHPSSSISSDIESDFLRLVHAAFRGRRKTMSNVLISLLPNADKSVAQQFLSAQGIDPQRRGETLTVEEFARLAKGIKEIGK
ncbi:MAG: hypothetical protein NZT92_18835, partial [Abditibacteriales bacterium]|nr:hypothetical protein [Abditibacteriales bacterium]MDW8367832.1 rRNA adenine N-6-methyltransferase family protein [Abditibacteriales bacterium]